VDKFISELQEAYLEQSFCCYCEGDADADPEHPEACIKRMDEKKNRWRHEDEVKENGMLCQICVEKGVQSYWEEEHDY
jgi:hypothetical protein